MVSAKPGGGSWPGSRAWLLGLGLLLVAAAVPRLIAITDDFWLDEIWSLRLAAVMEAPQDVLFRSELMHDNNHPLNTLWMYVVGQRDGWVAYRVPSLLAGLATVLLAAFAGARRSRLEGLVAGLLFATSYLMIAYSTEARGYSLAVACALGALLMFERVSQRWTWGAVVGFWGVSVLGFLSHLSFGHAYFALVGWSGWRVLQAAGQRRESLLRAAALHAVPMGCLAVLYLIFVSHMYIGGGPMLSLSLVEVLSRTLAWTLGGPVGSGIPLALGVLVLVAMAVDAVTLHREASDRWVFDLGVVLVVPAGALVVLDPEFIAPRYFLVAIAFFLLVWARLIARLLMIGSWFRAVGVALMLLFVGANAFYVVPFLQLGKGSYYAAVRYMVEHTDGDTISIARDPDAADPMMLHYYANRAAAGKTLTYYHHFQLPRQGVEWYVVNRQLGQSDPARQVRLGAHGYELQAKFDYAAPAGFCWWIYRRL